MRYNLEEKTATAVVEHLNRFISPTDECLIWTGMLPGESPICTIRLGGERFSIKPQFFFAELADPSLDLAKSQKVLAVCGNPLCRNPKHLIFNARFNTRKVLFIARVIREWQKKSDENISNASIASQLGVSYPTLMRYLAEYRRDPAFWDKYINLEGK